MVTDNVFNMRLTPFVVKARRNNLKSIPTMTTRKNSLTQIKRIDRKLVKRSQFLVELKIFTTYRILTVHNGWLKEALKYKFLALINEIYELADSRFAPQFYNALWNGFEIGQALTALHKWWVENIDPNRRNAKNMSAIRLTSQKRFCDESTKLQRFATATEACTQCLIDISVRPRICLPRQSQQTSS